MQEVVADMQVKLATVERDRAIELARMLDCMNSFAGRF
jgi:hypothetical protein